MADDLKVSADKHTREKLGLTDTVSKSDAQRIKAETRNSKEFRSTVEGDRLLVRRVLRD